MLKSYLLFRHLSASLVFVITASLLVFSSGAGNELPNPDSASSVMHSSVPVLTGETIPAYTGCGGVTVPAIREDYEQAVLDLVNQARADNHLPPFKRSSMLVEAARYHASDLATDNYFQHDSYDRVGSNLVFVCDTFERILSYYFPDWRAMAENIAAGQSDPEWVMRSWMSSSGHRANILSTQTWEIGIGYASGGSYSHYWVQDFGRREGVYPLIINREAAITDSPVVDLYIYGDWQEIRLRNDDDPWGAWQPFQNQISWVLNSGAGEHTVWAEMSFASRTAASSDVITLSGAASVASLGNLPTNLEFSYSLADGKLYPPSMEIIPLNNGSNDLLEWNISLDGNRFQVSPASGVTPQPITILPFDVSSAEVGVYQNTLTVLVSNPSGVLDSPQVIELTLRVTNQPMVQLFMPVAIRK